MTFEKVQHSLHKQKRPTLISDRPNMSHQYDQGMDVEP